MAALTELLARHGYAGVTIGALAARAGVSRAAFYAHFADKEACLLAAYDRFAEQVARAIAPELDDDAPWSEFIEAIVEGYVGILQRDLTATRAFLIEMDAAGPAARRRRREAAHAFAAIVAERHASIRRRDRSLASLPAPVYLALALGVRELVRDALEGDARPELGQLAPAMVKLVTAAVSGA